MMKSKQDLVWAFYNKNFFYKRATRVFSHFSFTLLCITDCSGKKISYSLEYFTSNKKMPDML